MLRFLLCYLIGLLLAFAADMALSAPLQTVPTYSAANPANWKMTTPGALVVKGTTNSNLYVLEADPTTGAIPVTSSGTPSAPSGRSYAASARNVYSVTNVTTGAWVQLIASTAATINQLHIFDSCGQTLELGTGAVASETRVFLIPPGGPTAVVDLAIPAGTRISVRAVSATCSTGELDITGLN